MLLGFNRKIIPKIKDRTKVSIAVRGLKRITKERKDRRKENSSLHYLSLPREILKQNKKKQTPKTKTHHLIN